LTSAFVWGGSWGDDELVMEPLEVSTAGWLLVYCVPEVVDLASNCEVCGVSLKESC